MTDRPLWPSLETIEHDLFAPSDSLIERWAADDPTVPPAQRNALESDPEAREKGRLAAEPVVIEPGPEKPVSPLPESLREAIGRRIAARSKRFSLPPKAGQIVSIERLVGPRGPLEVDLPRPLAMLLGETTETPEVWYGWLVSSETDYADWWSLLLEADDEPFDALAGMIQLANPAYLYAPCASRVLAELSDDRMQAVRSLASDFVTAPPPDPGQARPGRVMVRRTMDGKPVLTGTPLGGDDDPRLRYQVLYHAVAEVIQEPARQAIREAVTTTSHSGLIEALIERLATAAREVGTTFTPAAPVTHAMDAKPGSRAYRLGDGLMMQLSLIGEGADTVLKVECALTGGLRCVRVRLRQQGATLQELNLDSQNLKDELLVDPAREHTLLIEGDVGASSSRVEVALPKMAYP